MFFSLRAKCLQKFCTLCAVETVSLNRCNIPNIALVVVVEPEEVQGILPD